MAKQALRLDLDQRVRLPDGREGFVLGILFHADDTEEVEVMTDSYVEVTCRPDQLATLKRKPGGLVPVDSENKHKVYPLELELHRRLQRAIWHDHWQRHGGPEDFEDFVVGTGSVYDDYAQLYQQGKIEALPGEEDIRSVTTSQPRQLDLFGEVANGD